MSADLSRSAAGHVTTFVEAPATVADTLLLAEIELRTAGRRIEWLAVREPALGRESRIIFLSAARIRARRWAA